MLRAVANAAGSAIINHLESAAQAAPNASASFVSNEVLFRRRKEKLEQEVVDSMRIYELNNIEENEASVLGLYLHFFWTIPALVECCLWFGIYSAIWALLFVIYYIQFFFSCGKGCTKECNEDMRDKLSKIGKRWGYYFVTPTFLVGNLLMPWAPPLYFYKRYDRLLPPKGKRSTYRELTRDTREKHVPCVCWCCFVCTDNCMDDEECGCGAIEKHDIPLYMSIGRHLLTIGCGNACANIDDDEVILARAMEEAHKDTEKFYRSTYGGDVRTFDELCDAKLGGRVPPPETTEPAVVQGEVLTSSNLPSASTAIPVESHVITSGDRTVNNKA